jgi:cellulose synthase/poly-beta-1,6-N-acetylglucosamine synthase-like glycosyltransferase
MSDEMKAGVSVVVCVNRDVQKLERLLNCLFIQSWPLYEVVVVNDGPAKEIKEYLSSVERNPANSKNLRIIDFDSSTKTTPGKKAPLTAGIQAARYDWLLMTDGDCTVGPEWISEMMKHTGSGIEMVLGVAPFFSRRGFRNMLQRFDGLLTIIQYVGAALRGKPYMGVGRNLLYHRALFDKVNGFSSHTHLISGDDDLFIQSAANAHNTTICLHQDAYAFSDAPLSWGEWVNQKRRHLSASKAYSVRARFQTSVFAISWLCVWIGLPFVLSSGCYWLIAGIAGMIMLWLLFALTADQLQHRQLIPLYPVMAVSYCVMLFTFAILLSIRQPKTWMRS